MAQPGKQRYIEFRIVDIDGDPITDRDLEETTPGQRVLVSLFRDTVACTDPITLVNWGEDGKYYATYTPSAAGHDYLEIYDELYDLRYIDAEEVETPLFSLPDDELSDVITMTQDYGAVGRFKLELPEPEKYTLSFFRSIDWQSGRTDPSYAIIGTEIDPLGNWVSPELTILPDTYHVVVRYRNDIYVLAAFLRVELS
jgi:hypothetical protein